jgi:undecaprenyl-diphosphatase
LDDSATLRRLRGLFLVVFIVTTVAFASVTALVRHNPDGTGFDLQVASQFFRDAADNEAIAQAGRVLDVAGGNVVCLVVVAVVFVLLRRRHHPLLAAYLVASAIGGVLISSLVKGFIDRQRPATVGLLLGESTSSYPSGHATTSVAALGALGIVALAVLSPRIRVWVASVLLLFGAIVGLSRVWLGVHWPTDVIGGWLLGASWTSLVAVLVITTAIRD